MMKATVIHPDITKMNTVLANYQKDTNEDIPPFDHASIQVK
jgi:hypothetical protein